MSSYPGIPDPKPDPQALYQSVVAIKQALEILLGIKGKSDDAAVTQGDMKDQLFSLNTFVNQLNSNSAGYIKAGTTDTLTNKTIADATDKLGGVTMDMGSDATGDLYYRNASGILTRLPIGSPGQLLEVAGTPGLPSWQPAPANTWTLLNTLTASNSATLDDTTSFTSTYFSYALLFDKILPATNLVELGLQVHSGGAFQTTNYAISNSSTAARIALAGTGGGANTVGNTGPGVSGLVFVNDVAQTSAVKQFRGVSLSFTNGSTGLPLTQSLSGWWGGGNGAVDGIRVLTSSGNITSGTVRVYGIKG